jgi:hypothetical protein
MIYRILADAVLIIHLLWIGFLFLGGFLGRRIKTMKILHLSGLFFALFIQIFDWYCPLTHLEVWLRSKHDPDLAYAGSFLIHYAEQVVYMQLSHSHILIFTILLLVLNLWFYFNKRRPLSNSS